MIGKRIKELREARGITQQRLSEVIGAKTYTTVTKWESEENMPRGKDIRLLAEYFNVSSDYLLGMTDDPNSEQALEEALMQGDLFNEEEVREIRKLVARRMDELEGLKKVNTNRSGKVKGSVTRMLEKEKEVLQEIEKKIW